MGIQRAPNQAIRASGLGYSVLRNSLYAELMIDTVKRAIATGQLIAAAGEGKVAYVTREDCARAAAAALAAEYDGLRILDITGPQALSQAEVAAIASRLSGQAVTYVAIPHSALVDGMVGAGLPRPVAEIYASFDAGIAAGVLDVALGALQQLTGQAPMGLEDFLAVHREAILSA